MARHALHLSHALSIKAIALQINFGMQLTPNQLRGFSQLLSGGIRRHSPITAKTLLIATVKVKKKHHVFLNNLWF